MALNFNKQQVKLFFYWINERESIRQKKEAGKPWPWTKDQILRTYKFTNAFRKKDRTTADLIARVKHVVDAEELYWRICLFRLFNWTPTYDAIAEYIGPGNKGIHYAAGVLQRMKGEGAQLWTGAYMIHADPGEKINKVDSYMQTFSHMYREADDVVPRIRKSNTLQFATEILQRYNHIGAFIAYELACDFSYFKPLLLRCRDRYTWANTGPGAARGIHRLLWETDKKEQKNIDYVGQMARLLQMSEDYLEDHVGRLEMRDIEHSLCEFDKYSRVYNEEGRSPKQKYQQPKD